MAQVHAGTEGSSQQPLRFLAASKQQDHVLLAATATTVRLFDLRASSKPAALLRPHDNLSMVSPQRSKTCAATIEARDWRLRIDAVSKARLRGRLGSSVDLVPCRRGLCWSLAA